ncbi:hypothetical protein HPB51_014389 [Rhipicephalus microplus]|uniref:Small integral membrane protein 14 n=1 Tax=Rhipicephalus microplus TaxID=6941 RepID=A0A9J6F3T7_RHIMP|nr:hypothetical protein HPB51_014389 [Rhipicephalus microplus]
MDDGFDPCECIFSHDAAMQRLISLLRSSQSACTDSQCLQERAISPTWVQDCAFCFPTVPSMQQAASGSGFFLVMVGWMLLAMALYYLRPNSLRNRGDSKPDRQVGVDDEEKLCSRRTGSV